MRSTALFLAVSGLLLAGCSLAEDITPPPGASSGGPVGFSGIATQDAQAPAARLDAQAGAATRGEGPGVVQGRISNGTDGGLVPAGLEVTLHGLEGDQEVFTETGGADARGSFRFDGLEVAPGRLYFLTVEYAGVTYKSAGARLLPDEPTPLDLPLTVYETTGDQSQVRVAQVHLIFLAPREGVVSGSEVWVLSNMGDRTLIPGEGEWLLDVRLPLGAQVMEVQGTSGSDRFAQTEGGFTYSTPLIPGEGTAQAAAVFNVPYESRIVLSQPMSLMADSAVILVQEDSFQVRGVGLADSGPVQMGGTVLREYVAGPFAAGDVLEFTLTSIQFPWDLVVGSTAFAAALAAAATWWLRRRSVAATQAGEESRSDADLHESLLQAMADLDDAFEAGRIPEEVHRRRRQDLKRRLIARMKERHD